MFNAKLYFKTYYQAHKKELDNKHKEWAKNHKEIIKKQNQSYYINNKSKIIARTREYNKKWLAIPHNRAKRNEWRKSYRKNHTFKKYKYIWIEGKLIREHRYIMEQYLGRKLLLTEIVHHLDGNTLNNDIKNLTVMTHKDHAQLHNPIKHI